MRKIILLLGILLITLNIYSQQAQHEITVRNVVVPVRVFEGNTFVDNLNLEDFELYEDGVLQKIQALYLTNKTKLSKSEGSTGFAPPVSRDYYLLFQMLDYDAKLGEALDFFFTNVFQPEDNLTILTPIQTYKLPKKAIQQYSKEQISEEMKKILRKDVKIGSGQYKSLIRDLTRLVRALAGTGSMSDLESSTTSELNSSIEFMLPRYREALQQLENLRVVDQKWVLRFADQLRKGDRQKNVIFFYQREFRPEIHQSILNRLISQYQDQPNVLAELQDLFSFYHRYTRWDTTMIQKAFADSSLYFYFIYLNRIADRISGINMTEQSEDIFSTFREVAKATGGVVEATQNPLSGFKNAMTAADTCYFLYYSPINYKKDGKFKNIEVKIKGKGYRLLFRNGYYAR